MSDITNADIQNQINMKTEEYEDLAEANLQDLLTLANEKLWNNFGSASANLAKAREISLGSLNDLPSPRPEVNIPAFVFNPEDLLSPDLLQKYTYPSEFFDFLEPQLVEFITNETQFIDQTVQDALFQQTRERDLQTLSDAQDASDRVEARRAFPLHNSLSVTANNVVVTNYQNIQSDRNKEITSLIAERAQANSQHSIDAGIRMEDINSRFQLEYGRLYFQAAEYIVRKYQADIGAEVARVNSEIEQIKLLTQIDINSVGSDNTWNNTLVANLAQKVDQLIANANNDLAVQTAQSTQQMEALTKIINFYKDIHSSYTGQLNGINLVST